MGGMFGGGPRHDPDAERLRREAEAAKANTAKLEKEAVEREKYMRTKRYGYGMLLGDDGSSYTGYTPSQDKARKRTKTYALGGGGSVN